MEGATFDKNLDQLNAIFDGKVLWKKDDVVKPGDLGQFNANSWGLYDTMGGIPEFILDWTRPSSSIDKEKSYRPTTAVTDPTGMATPDNITLNRQSRGGRNNASTKITALLPGNAGNGYVETYDMGHRLCIHLKPITQIAD